MVNARDLKEQGNLLLVCNLEGAFRAYKGARVTETDAGHRISRNHKGVTGSTTGKGSDRALDTRPFLMGNWLGATNDQGHERTWKRSWKEIGRMGAEPEHLDLHSGME